MTMNQSPTPQSAIDRSSVSQHEVLRFEECATIRDQVLALEDKWMPRGEGGDFFTLGVAAYLDAPGQRDAYLKAAKETNPLLREKFCWLYERVRSGFEDLLGEPAFYDGECPLPGFHIFTYRGTDRSNDQPASRAHFDMQWMHAMPPGCRPAETLSFTLPIEEPSGGCSLEIWPVHCNSVPLDFDARKYAASSRSKTLRYSRGLMVVHDGLLLHAIGVGSVAAPVGYRITFQGHGVRVSEGWKLYW
jgi:hypothetical protein